MRPTPGWEEQPGGLGGFFRASWASAWLQYKGLIYHPSNLWLLAVQQWTMVAVWYFVSIFLSPVADGAVHGGSGGYVAYVLVGVLSNQVAMSALLTPFQTVSQAFWDKRLETYRLARFGIWGNLVGRTAWTVVFSAGMQALAAAALFAIGALPSPGAADWPMALLFLILLATANAGIGFMGASLFFLLEVKNGQDPITWIYQYLVQIVSGLYIPVAVLPVWLRGVGTILPQTYAFEGLRVALLGSGSTSAVGADLLGLAVGTGAVVAAGILLLRWALVRAEHTAGLGVVV